MKYIAVLDDGFLSNFRLDDEDKLTLVLTDKNYGTRAVRLKPVIRPTLVFYDGVSLYLNQGDRNAMLKHEETENIKGAIEQMNNSIKELGL